MEKRVHNYIDLTDKRFGLLVAQYELPKELRKEKKVPLWMCKCDCGKFRVVSRRELQKGDTKSCGHLLEEHQKNGQITHGKTGTVEHDTWNEIKKRTKGKGTQKNYDRYFARGIVMCKGWLSSFESFLEDMGERPTDKDSIDRKDNDGHYSCGHCDECLANGWKFNCHWATRLEQAQNTSANVFYEYNGIRLVQEEWARRFGHKNSGMLRHYLKTHTFEQAYAHYTSKNV